MPTKMLRYLYLTSFLLWFSIFPLFAQNTNFVSPMYAYAVNTCAKVTADSAGRIKEQITADALSDLPIGVARKYNETTYIIAIDSAYTTQESGWFFNAYMAVKFPSSQKPLAFAAKNIGFGKGGLSLSNSSKLMLVGDQTIRLSENIDLRIPGDGSNYIEFDCNGFKSIHLKGELIFSDSLLIPDYGTKPVPPNDKTLVKASFEVHTHDLNNIMFTTSITPFRVTSFQDVGFEVQEAVFDWSDKVNPVGYTFPSVYQTMYPSQINLWRGFYLKSMRATYYGTEKNDKTPLTFTATNLLIDDAGVSGLFSVSNLINFGEGSASGWPLSIETLSVELTQNRLTGGGLGGTINIPFLGKDTLRYSALMRTQGDEVVYNFSISPKSEKVYEMPFGGTLKLYSDSKISVEKIGKNWHPKAELTGEMSLMSETSANGEKKNDKLNVPKILFQDLTLTTDKPYLQKGTFSLSAGGQSRLKNFPIAIDKFGLGILKGKISLEIGLSMGFMEANDKGFSASTVVYITAVMEKEQLNIEDTLKARHKWKLEGIKIRRVAIDCNTTALYLKGSLDFFDKDPTFGDGFKGRIELKLPTIQEGGTKEAKDLQPFLISAYFGSLPTYRYWQIGVVAPITIPIVPPLKIKGIMLGVAYKMKRADMATGDFDMSKLQQATAADTTSLKDQEKQIFSYVPDKDLGLSLLAGVSWIVAQDKACNGDATLEMAFNAGGGVRYVRFDGSAYLMTSMNVRGVGKAKATNTSVPIYAKVEMLYDHPNRTFHANLSTYINAPGVMKGIAGPNGLVGNAIIHIDPQDWYVYVGKPSQRFGMEVMGLATTQSYTMIGSKIENLPLPPPEVAQMFSGINLSLMRDDVAAKAGAGFAMGMKLQIGKDFDNLDPFFITLIAGGGFDIMLRNYSGLQCKEREGPIGIKGWYASGQAYFYLNGRVGIRVKKMTFDIVKLAAAALLQAKLPNPSWLRGALAGNFSVLGGLVKGNFNVGFTLGNECELVPTGKELENIEVIQDLKPELNAQSVSIFSAPQVTFNTPIGQNLSIENMQGLTQNYKVVADEITVKKDGVALQGNLVWNANKDVAIFRTEDVLPPNADIDFVVKVHWEKQNDQGNWENLTDNGQPVIETKTHTFQTGAAPDFVPEENVEYCYPLKGQYHFHKAEHTQGYVKLKMGQPYLFVNSSNEIEWEYFAKFTSGTNEPLYMPLAYDNTQKMVSYNIPASLQKERNYKLQFVKLPKNRNSNIASNVNRTERQENSEVGQVSVNQVKLTGTQTQAIEKDLYRNFFRTSKFDSFGQKIDALTGLANMFEIATGSIFILMKNGTTSEVFDKWELFGNADQNPLVQTMASTQNNWFTNYAYPNLYQSYPIANDLNIQWRNPAVLGIEPLKAVKINTGTNNNSLLLTEQQSESAISPTISGNFNMLYLV